MDAAIALPRLKARPRDRTEARESRVGRRKEKGEKK